MLCGDVAACHRYGRCVLFAVNHFTAGECYKKFVTLFLSVWEFNA